jgi:hypothetical protein
VELFLGILFVASLVGLRIAFWVWRAREAAGPGPNPHAARALEDSFKRKKKKRTTRGIQPADGRQIAGEECAECGDTIVAEIEGTACGVCDALLHQKRCAKRHVCDAGKADDAQPYRA